VLVSQTNTEPFNRGHDDLSVQYGRLVVDGLTFDGCRSGGMPLVQISDDNPTGAAVTHLRNVRTVNWGDGTKARAVVNLGGGPRPTPKSDKGVPVYVHDWFGPGRTAVVVSVKSGEFKADPSSFRTEPPLTGDGSRVAEVKDVSFPPPPAVADDLPPATVVTRVIRENGKLLVRGTCTDNGTVARVTVNGRPARATADNFADWELTLDAGTTRIEAGAEDAAGNRELTPMVLAVR
jgi:hypothetical protein